MSSPIIGLTAGDPAGVGPEIILKIFREIHLFPETKFVVFGQRRIFQIWCEHLCLEPDFLSALFSSGKVELRETGEPLEEVIPGKPAAAGGRASFEFFGRAVESALAGEIQAVVTAPVSKASWHLAGIKYRGHTEYLEEIFPGAIMSFWSDRLKAALFTHHLPLKAAVDRVRQDDLLEFFRNLHRAARRWNLGIEEILMCGLNPHAGEDGTLGTEELTEIIPAIARARAEGIRISGPFPPDTIFLRAVDRLDKMVACLYHDQALIAFKLLSFERGVNLTLGLPFIRTSPDHGTAFDIAGKGLASAESFREAIKLARELIRGRRA
ncbi:MAG: 4-hydroxythreonine-4-phosphate dehydrogenase PdxA [Candidatus Saccharicenans sp.]|nr:4-hydroxythreonine-4-phosphate dehydrogenase PdxA [Candidatus Saccharicenans sp.]